MIASVKQGESVSSERYKKKRKRQKKTDALEYDKKGPDGIAVGP